MPSLSFSHPDLRPGPALKYGATEIRWSYNMNAVTFPTYGGEVIQILSVNIGNITMAGQFGTYREMEEFYGWFIDYLQIASQGRGNQRPGGGGPGVSAYNQQPVTFYYPHRGWQIDIMPTELPGFRQATDVVAPEWRMTAFVVDAQDDVTRLEELIRSNITIDGLEVDEGEFSIQGEIGYIEKNPWSSPFPDEKVFDPDKTSNLWSKAGDYYTKLIPSYLSGDFDTITSGIASSPAFLNWGQPSTNDTSAAQEKKKVGQIRKGGG